MSKPKTQPLSLDIQSIGAGGDGIAQWRGRPIYVPFAAPGDRLLARPGGKRGEGLSARILEIQHTGPDRVAPICPVFGTCGGCTLQHLDPSAVLQIKRQWIIDALSRVGLSTDLRDGLAVPTGHRRRASLKARRLADRVVLGFHAAFSHTIVDIDRCPLLVDRLNSLLAPLRSLFGRVLDQGDRAEAMLSAADRGIEIVLTLPRDPNLDAREALSAFADETDVARLWWRPGPQHQPEPLALRTPFQAVIGDLRIDLPVAPFLQAAHDAEVALLEMADATLPEQGRLADLFCGWGGFALTLLGRPERNVLAVDADGSAIEALVNASRDQGLTHRLDAQCRDLFRDPLTPVELDDLDGVVFDPPRAGARAQAEMLAASRVGTILGVSCNPATFARDARILTDGGYALEWVQPIDQFTHGAHVELAGLFRKRYV